LALLATADVGVVYTLNRATARDDAIAAQVVLFHQNAFEVYTVRAARVGGAHADPIVVTQDVVEHLGVLRVPNVDTTTVFGTTVAANLVVLEFCK
jgi:hypothetical protein